MFNVKLNLVILSTQIDYASQYILSTDSQEIKFPYIELNKEILQDIDKNIIENIKSKYLPETSYYDLLPQLISLSTKISDNNDILDVLYGFVVPYTNTIINSHWIKFNYLEPSRYNNLIFSIIQRLK